MGGVGVGGERTIGLCVCASAWERCIVWMFFACDEALKTGAPQHLCAHSSSTEGPARIDGTYGSGVCSCLRVGGVPV